jgi:NAD-dependent DNA ligase
VAGEDAGSKLDKAKELKVPVIEQAGLLKLLG